MQCQVHFLVLNVLSNSKRLTSIALTSVGELFGGEPLLALRGALVSTLKGKSPHLFPAAWGGGGTPGRCLEEGGGFGANEVRGRGLAVTRLAGRRGLAVLRRTMGGRGCSKKILHSEISPSSNAILCF